MKTKTETSYRVISVSLYMEDLDRADMIVAKLKDQGVTAANRSWLIRQALATMDDESIALLARGVREGWIE